MNRTKWVTDDMNLAAGANDHLQGIGKYVHVNDIADFLKRKKTAHFSKIVNSIFNINVDNPEVA